MPRPKKKPEVAAKKPAAKKKAPKKMPSRPKVAGNNWVYFRVGYRLITPMLSTVPEGDVMKEHLIEKAKKMAEKANRLDQRITKLLDKYKGTTIPDSKEVKELQANIRSFGELTGRNPEEVLPNNMDDLLPIAEQVSDDYRALVASGEEVRGTMFLKMNAGEIRAELGNDALSEDIPDDQLWPVISTHMLLGNFKENARIVTNNGEPMFQSKVSVGEIFALDVKATTEFMVPSKDIVRNQNGDRELLERIVRFNDKGTVKTAICVSEQLPKHTEFGCILRVRRTTTVSDQDLEDLLDYGKNNGLGSWRGSGHMGAYIYQFEELPDYQETWPEGWK